MEFARVEPTTFRVEGGADYGDQAAREVTLTKPFYVLRNKVAQAEYEKSGLRGKSRDASWDDARVEPPGEHVVESATLAAQDAEVLAQGGGEPVRTR